jgi:hypothetical protein
MRSKRWSRPAIILIILCLLVPLATPFANPPQAATALTPEQTKLLTEMDAVLKVLSADAQFTSVADTAYTGVGALSSSLQALNSQRTQLLSAMDKIKQLTGANLPAFLKSFEKSKEGFRAASASWLKLWNSSQLDSLRNAALADPDWLRYVAKVPDDEVQSVVEAVRYFNSRQMITESSTAGARTFLNLADDAVVGVQRHSQTLKDFFYRYSGALETARDGMPSKYFFQELGETMNGMVNAARQSDTVLDQARTLSSQIATQGGRQLSATSNSLDDIAKWAANAADDLENLSTSTGAQLRGLDNSIDVVNRWSNTIETGGSRFTPAQRFGLFMTTLNGLVGTVKAIQEARMGQTDEACHTIRNTAGGVAVDLLLLKLGQVGSATVSAAMGWIVVGAFAGEAIATYIVEAPVRDLAYMDGLINNMFDGKPESLYRHHFPQGRQERLDFDMAEALRTDYLNVWDGHSPGYTTTYARNPSAYQQQFANALNVEWEAWKK